MRKWLLSAVALSSIGVLPLERHLAAAPPLQTPTREIRIFVFDKSWHPVEVRSWTGAVDVMPVNGLPQAFRLDVAGPSAKHRARNDPAPSISGSQAAPAARDQHAHPVLCGQVIRMEEWRIEMVVIRPAQGGGKRISDESLPQVVSGEGFVHDHGASYFRATVETDALKDPKSGTLDFRATLVLTLPDGDTRYVKGFEYPEGMTGDALDRFIEGSFKESSNLGRDQAPLLACRVRWMLSTIPPLSFNTDDDRRDYEKALRECFLSCQRLEQATGKDIAAAADQCKSALRDFQNQARDSRGALIVD